MFFRIFQGTDKVEAMQIDVSQITNLPLEVDTLKRMSPLPFLKFNLPTPAEAELSMSPNPAPFRSPENQDALLSSAGCKELMSIANEIHIKCHDYLLIEGCSDPSLPSSIEISRLQKITHPVMEIILNHLVPPVYGSFNYKFLNPREINHQHSEELHNLSYQESC